MQLLRDFEQWVENSPRWLTAALVFVPLYALYFLINRFPIFEPATVPMLPGESNIPMLGWTAFVYVSVVFEIILAFRLLPQRGFGKIVTGAVIILVLHLAFFAIFPTSYPRNNIESVPWALALIRKVDLANNAFPSLHVSIGAYIAFALWRTRGWLLGLSFTCWAVLIALSTLTTKQHSILDVAAGMVIAVIVTKKLASQVPISSPA